MSEEYGGSGNINFRRNMIILIGFTIGIALLLDYAGLNRNQVIATSILAATVIGTLLFWGFRVAIAFLGISTLLLSRTLDIEHLIEFASLEVILFLVGMMTLVGMLKDVGFW